ncbi:toxin glutamine deamidase domain-containing protein [Actinokineospora inagensis]|uniref:toxin glutamine deamidase domain-containing protein n=1 Tax=Actinokineospora inagensis TaxID=103730 RepID=UPI0012F7C808|nr:toxin glutamine deamidase domain-containing protein [Actinokineospora inagensis]
MVPDDVRRLFLVITGEEWPDADEGRLHGLAEAWETAGRRLSGELGPELRRAVGAIRSTFSGEAELAFAGRVAPFVEGADNYVDAAAGQFHGLAQYLHDLAVDVEYVKLVSVLSLVALAVEIGWAAAAAAETGGASMVWLAQRVALVRYLLKSALGRLALRLAQAELVGMAFQAVIDVIAQGVQFAMGTRHTWNTGYTTTALAVGALGGVLMLPLSAVGEVLARAAAQGVESVVAKFAKFAKTIPAWAHTVPELVSEIGVEAFHEVFTETLYNFLTTGEFSMNVFSATSGGFSGAGGAAGRAVRHRGTGHLAVVPQIHSGHHEISTMDHKVPVPRLQDTTIVAAPPVDPHLVTGSMQASTITPVAARAKAPAPTTAANQASSMAADASNRAARVELGTQWTDQPSSPVRALTTVPGATEFVVPEAGNGGGRMEAVAIGAVQDGPRGQVGAAEFSGDTRPGTVAPAVGMDSVPSTTANTASPVHARAARTTQPESTRVDATEQRTAAKTFSPVVRPATADPVLAALTGQRFVDFRTWLPQINTVQGTLNCVYTSTAVLDTWWGSPTTAEPQQGKIDELRDRAGFDVEVVGYGSPAIDRVARRLLAEGPGSSAMVVRSLAGADISHAWNLLNQDGVVYHVDGQSGKWWDSAKGPRDPKLVGKIQTIAVGPTGHHISFASEVGAPGEALAAVDGYLEVAASLSSAARQLGWSRPGIIEAAEAFVAMDATEQLTGFYEDLGGQALPDVLAGIASREQALVDYDTRIDSLKARLAKIARASETADAATRDRMSVAAVNGNESLTLLTHDRDTAWAELADLRRKADSAASTADAARRTLAVKAASDAAHAAHADSGPSKAWVRRDEKDVTKARADLAALPPATDRATWDTHVERHVKTSLEAAHDAIVEYRRARKAYTQVRGAATDAVALSHNDVERSVVLLRGLPVGDRVEVVRVDVAPLARAVMGLATSLERTSALARTLTTAIRTRLPVILDGGYLLRLLTSTDPVSFWLTGRISVPTDIRPDSGTIPSGGRAVRRGDRSLVDVRLEITLSRVDQGRASRIAVMDTRLRVPELGIPMSMVYEPPGAPTGPVPAPVLAKLTEQVDISADSQLLRRLAGSVGGEHLVDLSAWLRTGEVLRLPEGSGLSRRFGGTVVRTTSGPVTVSLIGSSTGVVAPPAVEPSDDALRGAPHGSQTAVTHGAVDATMTYWTSREVTVAVAGRPDLVGRVYGLTALPVLEAARVGLPMYPHISPGNVDKRIGGGGRYRIGTDAILDVPGRKRIAAFVAEDLDLTGRAEVGKAFADRTRAASALYDALHGGLEFTWRTADERTVVLEVHGVITPPRRTFLSPQADSIARDHVAYWDGTGVSAISAATRVSGFPGVHHGFTGDLELVVVRREIVGSRVVRPTLFDGSTERFRLVEPTAADVAAARESAASPNWRHDLRAMTVPRAVVVSTAADKLVWADRPPVATPGFSPGLYVGEPPPLSEQVSAHEVTMDMFGVFANVEHVRMSPAMVEAPRIALATRVEATAGRPRWLRRSGSDGELVVPGTDRWPSWRRHPDADGPPSSPVPTRRSSLREQSDKESTMDNQDGRVRYRAMSPGSDLPSWGERELVESTRSEGTPGRLLRYRLSPLTKPGSASNEQVRGLASRSGARVLALHGIDSRLDLPQLTAMGQVDDMGGVLDVRVRYLSPRLVDIRVDGFLRHTSEAHTRVDGAGSATVEPTPGSHHELDYRGPTAFIALDARYTFTGDIATRVAGINTESDSVQVTVDEPEAVLVQLPLHTAVEMFTETGLPQPAMAPIHLDRKTPTRSGETQQLLPDRSGYVAYGPTVVSNSQLDLSGWHGKVFTRLTELGVTGEWADDVVERVDRLFHNPAERVNLTEALGGVHALSVPGSGTHVTEVVDIRVSATRTTAADLAPIGQADLTVSVGGWGGSVTGSRAGARTRFTDTYPSVDVAQRQLVYNLTITRRHVPTSPVSPLTLTVAGNANRAAAVRSVLLRGTVGLTSPDVKTSPPMPKPDRSPTVTVLDRNPLTTRSADRHVLDPDAMWSVVAIGSATTTAIANALYAQLGRTPLTDQHPSAQQVTAAARLTSRYTEPGTPSELAVQKLTTGPALRTAAWNLFTGGSTGVDRVPGTGEPLGVRIHAQLRSTTFTLMEPVPGASTVEHSREVPGSQGRDLRQSGPSYLFSVDAEFYLDTPATTTTTTRVSSHQDIRIRVWEPDALNLGLLSLADIWRYAGVKVPVGLTYAFTGDGVILHLKGEQAPKPPEQRRPDGRTLYVGPNVPRAAVVELVRGLPLRTRPTTAYAMGAAHGTWAAIPLPAYELGSGPITPPRPAARPAATTPTGTTPISGTAGTNPELISDVPGPEEALPRHDDLADAPTNSVDAVLAYHSDYNTARADWTQHPLEYMGSGAQALSALIDRVTLAGHGSAALVFGRLPDGSRHGWNLVNHHNQILLVDPHLDTSRPAGPDAIPDLGLVHAIVLNADNHRVGGTDLPAGIAHEFDVLADDDSPNWLAHLERVDLELHDARGANLDLGASSRSPVARRIAALGQHRQRVIAHHVRAAAERGTVIELPDHEGLLVPYRGGWVLLSHTPADAGRVAQLAATVLNGSITAMVVDPNLNDLRHLKFPPRGRPLPTTPPDQGGLESD